MSLPRLNRLMVLEGPQRTPDGAGGHETTWTTLGSLFVDVMKGTGRQSIGQIAPLSRGTFRAIVRAAAQNSPSRPKPGQRLRVGNRLFRIDAVTEYDRGGLYLCCYVVEEALV